MYHVIRISINRSNDMKCGASSCSASDIVELGLGVITGASAVDINLPASGVLTPAYATLPLLSSKFLV